MVGYDGIMSVGMTADGEDTVDELGNRCRMLMVLADGPCVDLEVDVLECCCVPIVPFA